MYNILVVDDNSLIIKGISKKIEKMNIDVTVVATALNATEAMDILVNEKIDILITDIRMPNIDGISLIKKVKNVNSNIQFIIISGYDDFHYAQKAIKLGVSDFILKPIDKEELNLALNKICLRLDSKVDNEDIIYSSFYNAVYGKSNTNLDTVKEKLNYIIMSINGHIETKLEIVGKIEKNKRYERYIEINKNNISNILLVLKEDTNAKELIKYIEQEIKAIENINKVSLGFTYGITIDSLEEAYEKSIRNLLSMKLKNESDGISSKNAISEINEYKKQLEVNFIAMNIGQIDNVIEKMFMNINKYNLAELKLTLSSIINVLYNELDSLIIDRLKKNINSDEYLINIDMKELKEEYKELFSELLMVKDNHTNKSVVIKSILKYINNNYTEDINLSSLASSFHMSDSHLSKMFKSEVGKNITQYVTEIKINKAKELLINSGISISDISKSIGYYDYAYFNRVFKKNTGSTPKEYRNRK